MRKRVLVVDDDDDIREVAAASLELVGGWDVLTANCAAEAIMLAETEQPDAILLDVMMPDMDGASAARRLRAGPKTRHIPVVLLTAKVQPGDRNLFEDLPVVAVIAKPFRPTELPSQLAEVLGW